ncbi:tryptophan--tRNA ligase, mitochondrial isoform X1 [Polistes fuscatus]|uniref:tryptophan--tRNA ligase, mitochondrial isoform X1 n=1 Tax=Polistes fuscatus TaxID=30207 RepID=UPI001CA9D611|nr:tryptophan--tRNA ligase, mitochondrial isoform X1 [Polistes fuscatus]XP_043486865.1 tryptophan--tRNA ligase, mitochondrial isoform X1 [Polistes fuscatus]XP_043486866.1 tryptophan--tRNA ligase, mitochondrial isoform X1 [Polistes fuscatus]
MIKIVKCGGVFVSHNWNINIYHSAQSIRSFSQKLANTEYPRRIFSGIQPTGNVHLGNYLGAIQKWVELQNSEKMVIWSIADMHSITLSHNPKVLRDNIFKITATLLACGIDPQKSILFQQSSVPMHAELCWILGCITTMARLGHLPQFKEKSESLQNIPLGIYIYPVLQAADILLYRATNVPVGLDQAQHIQLSQDLAHSFNKKYGDTFPIPRTLICNDYSCRIKSLRDPTKKMSKSDKDVKSRLDLIDKPEVLLEKIKKSLTDFTSEVTYEPETRPGVSNLIAIHSLLTGKSPEEICQDAQGLNTGKYKLLLADVIIEKLKPIQEEISRLLNEQLYLDEVLKMGSEKATEIAFDCYSDVKDKIGFKRNVTTMTNEMAKYTSVH